MRILEKETLDIIEKLNKKIERKRRVKRVSICVGYILFLGLFFSLVMLTIGLKETLKTFAIAASITALLLGILYYIKKKST